MCSKLDFIPITLNLLGIVAPMWEARWPQWLVRSSPDRAVRVRALARGHCVVFLGKILNSHSASLHPDV